MSPSQFLINYIDQYFRSISENNKQEANFAYYGSEISKRFEYIYQQCEGNREVFKQEAIRYVAFFNALDLLLKDDNFRYYPEANDWKSLREIYVIIESLEAKNNLIPKALEAYGFSDAADGIFSTFLYALDADEYFLKDNSQKDFIYYHSFC